MMHSTPMWRRYLRFFGSNVGENVEEELRFHLEAMGAKKDAESLWTR